MANQSISHRQATKKEGEEGGGGGERDIRKRGLSHADKYGRTDKVSIGVTRENLPLVGFDKRP